MIMTTGRELVFSEDFLAMAAHIISHYWFNFMCNNCLLVYKSSVVGFGPAFSEKYFVL